MVRSALSQVADIGKQIGQDWQVISEAGQELVNEKPVLGRRSSQSWAERFFTSIMHDGRSGP